MFLEGRVWRFGDHINTDDIIPARYLNTTDALELARHSMEDLRPGFVKQLSKGDIIVAGKNFGCGSSREHAPLTLKGLGIACVIAESFAGIFFRNAINIGLPILECDKVSNIMEGDTLKVDFKKGEIINKTKDVTYTTSSFPPFLIELMNARGLMNWIKDQKCTK